MIHAIGFVVIGVIVVLASAVSYMAAALPGCASCHMDGDFSEHTLAAGHAGVECVSCHVNTSAFGRTQFAVRHVGHVIAPSVMTGDRAYAFVPDERCRECHAGLGIPSVQEARGLRITHASCAGGFQCVDCHSTTAHGPSTRWPRVAQMEDCFECHGQSNKLTECTVCHSDDKYERSQSGTTVFSVTHGPNWERTHGMGAMRSCSACHDAAKCAGCHGSGVPHEGDFRISHARYSASPDADCDSCHRSAFCIDCHIYEMPHPVEFIVEHSSTVEADGDQRCKNCHADSDCVECHVKHVHPLTQEQMDVFLKSAPERSGSP